MPNWCSNYVTVKHSDPQKLADLLAMINSATENKGLFQQINPMPEKLLSDDGWYDWRVANWGTKWDVHEFDVLENGQTEDQVLEFAFSSAWSPPIEVFEVLKDQGYHVKAQYVDEAENFVGEWLDGNDECYSAGEDFPEHLLHLLG